MLLISLFVFRGGFVSENLRIPAEFGRAIDRNPDNPTNRTTKRSARLMSLLFWAEILAVVPPRAAGGEYRDPDRPLPLPATIRIWRRLVPDFLQDSERLTSSFGGPSVYGYDLGLARSVAAPATFFEQSAPNLKMTTVASSGMTSTASPRRSFLADAVLYKWC